MQEVPITVTSETGRSKNYTLKVLKKSDNPNIKDVFIDENLIEADESGTRYLYNIKGAQDTIKIRAIAENDKASIQIGDEKVRIGEASITLLLDLQQKNIVVPIVVTSQDGAYTNTYQIVLTRLSNNTNIEELTLNDEPITLNENGEYVTNLKVGIELSELVIKLEDSNASVRIDENAEYTPSELRQTLETPGKQEIRKTIQVMAEDTTIQEYPLIINRKKNDLRISQMYVDNRVVTKVDDNTFTIDVLNSKDSITIDTLAVSETEFVQIGELEPVLSNAVAEDYPLTSGENIIPIKVHADDMEEFKEYNLIIKRVNTVDELSDLRVTIIANGNEIVPNSRGEYQLKVELTETLANVEAYTHSDTTMIKIDDGEFSIEKAAKEVELVDVNTRVLITLRAGDGTIREVVLNITKKVGDNLLKELQANGEVIEANEEDTDPEKGNTYTVYVDQNASEVELQATANMEFATVSIDGQEEETGVSKVKVDLQNVDTKEIKIIVTAVNDDTREYTVYIIKRGKIVNRIITETAEGNEHVATVTVYKTSDTRKENDANDPREVITQITTSGDGSYEINLEAGNYDLVITKDSYLEYRITNIELPINQIVELKDINILAGDVNHDGQIEISDLTGVTYNFGEITEEALEDKTEEEIKDILRYDLNEDGRIDTLDREIVKKNYNKKNTIIEWTPPLTGPEKYNFAFPLDLAEGETYSITSPYGMRKHPTTGVLSKHTGIDIRASWHIGILAAQDGEVVFAGDNGAFGNAVEIKHIIDGEEVYTFYGHLSRIDVKVGDKVERGQQIGLEGGDASDDNPGNSTGHHLHFEVRTKSGYGNDVDPNGYIYFK